MLDNSKKSGIIVKKGGAMMRMIMMRMILVFCVAGVVVGGMIGVTATKAESAEKPLKIGALYDFSGPLAGFGKKAYQGLQMAVKDFNAKGGVLGRQIELIPRDTKAYMDESAIPRYIEELITKEQVAYISGGYSDTVTTTIRRMTTSRDVAHLAPTPCAVAATRGPQTPLSLSWFLCEDERAFSMVPYLMINRLVPKKWVLMGPDYTWGWDNNKAFKNAVLQ